MQAISAMHISLHFFLISIWPTIHKNTSVSNHCFIIFFIFLLLFFLFCFVFVFCCCYFYFPFFQMQTMRHPVANT